MSDTDDLPDGDEGPLAAPAVLAPALEPALPFSSAELRRAFRRPLRVLDVVFTERDRLVATLAARNVPLALVGVLLFASVVFALPYGAVLGWGSFWRVAATFLGALAVCFPSLHVFCAYAGLRLRVEQNAALALVIPTVAALFTFGFFPILWFLKATMLADSAVTPGDLSVVLLVASLLAGIGHLYRCLPRMAGRGGYVVLTLGWQVLFVFITHRMASLLGVW